MYISMISCDIVSHCMEHQLKIPNSTGMYSRDRWQATDIESVLVIILS